VHDNIRRDHWQTRKELRDVLSFGMAFDVCGPMKDRAMGLAQVGIDLI
jgi:hypothetical protein